MSGSEAWTDFARRLQSSHNYWLVSSAPNGEPHVAPIWGVVVGDRLHFYSERNTVKARNLAADSRVVVHLESGTDVVIVHGSVVDLGQPGDHPDVMSALERKYFAPDEAQYLPTADPAFDVLWRLEPTRAMSWELADYDTSQRRWRASG